MYQTCLTCTENLGANTEVENLPIGARLAFDSNVGRLWVVCPKCAKWNLVPFDHRLEAIDDCERIYEATKTRFATDNIGMAKTTSGLTLIRVGKPLGEEFASWRYGESFRLRRKRTRIVTGLVTLPTMAFYVAIHGGDIFTTTSFLGGVGAVLATGAGGYNGYNVGKLISDKGRGNLRLRHPRSQKRIKVKQGDLKLAKLLTQGGVLGLALPFGRVNKREDLLFEGEAGVMAAGRVLGKMNASHGTAEQIVEANTKTSALLRAVGDGGLYGAVARLVPNRNLTFYPLAGHDPAISLALEMFANEDTERRFLTGELNLLERQWREAEELAKIADDLFLPEMPGQ